MTGAVIQTPDRKKGLARRLGVGSVGAAEVESEVFEGLIFSQMSERSFEDVPVTRLLSEKVERLETRHLLVLFVSRSLSDSHRDSGHLRQI